MLAQKYYTKFMLTLKDNKSSRTSRFTCTLFGKDQKEKVPSVKEAYGMSYSRLYDDFPTTGNMKFNSQDKDDSPA